MSFCPSVQPSVQAIGSSPSHEPQEAVLRVAFIDQTGNEAGGAQESLALLMQHLPSGVDPLAVFFNDGAFAETVREIGIDTLVVPLGRSSTSSTRERVRAGAFVELPGALRNLASALARARADVAHTNTVKAHALGCAAARLAGLPCVAHLRDTLEGFGRLAVRTAILAGTRERIAISKAVDRSFALPRTTVVDNPLDLPRYERRLERSAARAELGIPVDGTPLIAMVGRINRWKGHDRFLRAIATVRKTLPVRAAIAGAPRFRDADFIPELHAQVRALALEDAVTFVGWQADPRAIYGAIDVHVNASTREPFGRTAIEAAAMSVPTVCFDDSGVAESMLRDGIGIVVPAGDERRLAEGIARYAGGREEREAAGSAARVWSRRFDATLHARRVCEVLVRASARG